MDETTNPERDWAIVAMLAAIFHGPYCRIEGIREDQKHMVFPHHFFDWLKANLSKLDPQAVARGAGADVAHWPALVELVEGTIPVERTRKAWYQIALANRPQSPKVVRSWSSMLVVRFGDGTLSVLNRSGFPREPSPVSDGQLCSLVARESANLLEEMAAQGVAGMHADGLDLGSGEALRNVVQHVAPLWKASRGAIADQINRLMTVLAALVEPDRPAEAGGPAPPPPAPAGGARGGFDA